MSKTTFYASNVPVLNLTYAPDSKGCVIPPEAVVKFPVKMRVTYGADEGKPVGSATLRREGNQILANMELVSSMTPLDSSEVLIRKLYPATGFIVLQAIGQTIFELKIYELFVTPHGNDDKSIETLDKYLTRAGELTQ